MIRAIETKYNGHRFRSRTEARWAVFFDAMDISYVYEKEGYDLGKAGWYLPDFWLNDLNCWFEVKPFGSWEDNVWENCLAKCLGLAAYTNKEIYIFYDCKPASERWIEDYNMSLPRDNGRGFYPDGNWDPANIKAFGFCIKCKQIHIGYHFPPFSNKGPCNVELSFKHPRLLKAFNKARSERF
jgi:hypothetical protein